MADTQTAVFNLVKPEIGGSIDTWGVKLNANADLLEAALVNAVRIDGTNDFTALQTFDEAGFKIGLFTVSVVAGVLEVSHDTNGLLLTLDEDGNLSAKEVIADPSLA